jgi:hypothetical protein
MFVGAKHDRSQYEMITNNLYAVMLRPLQKPDAPEFTSIGKVKQAFGLTTVEGVRFFPSNVSQVSCERLGTCLLC